MKLNPCQCPECNGDPVGTVEYLSGVATLDKTPDGAFEYSGDTRIWYDEQKSDRDEYGRVLLICENGHEWRSEMSDDEESASVNTAPQVLAAAG